MGRGLDGFDARSCRCLLCSSQGPRGSWFPHFPVAMARGKHLFPFRTEQLSPSAPMVLGSQGPGRVGRRRFFLLGRPREAGRPSVAPGVRTRPRRARGPQRSALDDARRVHALEGGAGAPDRTQTHLCAGRYGAGAVARAGLQAAAVAPVGIDAALHGRRWGRNLSRAGRLGEHVDKAGQCLTEVAQEHVFPS